MQLEVTQEETGFLRPASGSPDSSSPNDHNEVGYALIVLVDKLDVLSAGDPENRLALAMDPQKVTLDPGGRKKNKLKFAIAGLLHELDAINRLELDRPPGFLIPSQARPASTHGQSSGLNPLNADDNVTAFDLENDSRPKSLELNQFLLQEIQPGS
jgi:hypothetical protein